MSDVTDLTDSQQAAVKRIERLAWLLDRSFSVPGTRIRFGLDNVIGLIPGVGDGASLLLGLLIIGQSFQFRLPFGLRARMAGNLVFDVLLGVVPLLGDLMDVAFQANQRNVALLLEALGIYNPSDDDQPLFRSGADPDPDLAQAVSTSGRLTFTTKLLMVLCLLVPILMGLWWLAGV